MNSATNENFLKCVVDEVVINSMVGMNNAEKLAEILRRNYDYSAALKKCR